MSFPADPTGFLARIAGDGIEIGAFQTPVEVGPAARVRYVDLLPADAAARQFDATPHGRPVVTPDVVAPADRLPMPDASLDFVLASHLIEHLEDPIAALVEWRRVLKPDGILYLRVPDQRGTFDCDRERTRLSHLLDDHRDGPESPARRARDLEHYRDWARCVSGLTDPGQVEFWARLLARGGYPIHFHCWTSDDFRELLAHLAASGAAPFDILAEDSRKDRYEFTVVARPRTPDRQGANP